MKRDEWQNSDPEQLAIAGMVELRLRANAELIPEGDAAHVHPDSDFLTSYVEGQLGLDEAQTMISHLVRCASCRHLTAQYARTFSTDDEIGDAVTPAEKLSAVEGIIERLRHGFAPVSEDAVFAYHETDQGLENSKLESSAGDEDEKPTQPRSTDSSDR